MNYPKIQYNKMPGDSEKKSQTFFKTNLQNFIQGIFLKKTGKLRRFKKKLRP